MSGLVIRPWQPGICIKNVIKLELHTWRWARVPVWHFQSLPISKSSKRIFPMECLGNSMFGLVWLYFWTLWRLLAHAMMIYVVTMTTFDAKTQTQLVRHYQQMAPNINCQCDVRLSKAAASKTFWWCTSFVSFPLLCGTVSHSQIHLLLLYIQTWGVQDSERWFSGFCVPDLLC